jgi:hypothetical protein
VNLIHLKHTDIDKEKWDTCIANSIEPIVFAESWYLDIVSPNWEAIVEQDYSIVFPITISYKYKIALLVNPVITRQLGVFSSGAVSTAVINKIYKLAKHSLTDICVNQQLEHSKLFTTKSLAYLKLPLIQTYEELRKSFKKNCIRNINNAYKHNLKAFNEVTSDDFIDFSKKNCAYHMKEKAWIRLKQIFEASIKNKTGFSRIIHDNDNNVLSMAFFIKRFNRIIFLSGYSSELGFEKRSMFFLMNEIIKEYSNTNNILDFNGSSNPNIARFYAGFGSVEDNFYQIQSKAFGIIKKLKGCLTC